MLPLNSCYKSKFCTCLLNSLSEYLPGPTRQCYCARMWLESISHRKFVLKNPYETINEVLYCTLMSEVNVENKTILEEN